MKTLDEVRAELRAMLPDLRRRYPVAQLGVFGSYARGEQREGSDLDLLVDLDGPIGMFLSAISRRRSLGGSMCGSRWCPGRR